MTLSLALLLIPYSIIVLLFLLLAVLNVYHLICYGATTRISFLFTFLFVAGTLAIAFFSWQALGDVVWSSTVSFSPFSGSATELPQF